MTTALRRWRWSCHVETLLLAASLWWLATANATFFAGVRQAQPGSAVGYLAALAVVVAAVHYLLLALVATRWTLRPLLALMCVATAGAVFYMRRYGVHLDSAMVRNIVRTDVREAAELLTPALLPALLLHAGVPLLLLWRTQLLPWRSWRQALLVRAGSMLLAAAVLAGAVLAFSQPMASLLRNHKPLRSLVTPANWVWALGTVAGRDARGVASAIRPIGRDAVLAAQPARPRVVVLVVGETARAANWGLNGAARQTTPELAALDPIVWRDVTSCGTSTEVSLPCMFAPVGRRDHDEARIRGSESLLDVVQRAGVGVLWRDNQSGCKGVCDRVPNEHVGAAVPGCSAAPCFDAALLHGLDARLAAAGGTQLLVLHQMGNHGPGYFRRYPPAFERFTPACHDDDLQHCTRQEIANAYDNALLYTDHVLATLIAQLQAASGRVDSALLYVSDHGESLGENGLYLHGLPYAIAPDVQKKVPMLLWLSPGFAAGYDGACLRRRALQPASHDNLFHTVLALLDVRTALHAPELDLTTGCRRGP